MRIGLSVGVLALLVAVSMCATAWAKPTPASPFAETAQAATDQYVNPTNPGTTPTRQVLVPVGAPAATRGGLAFTGLDLTVVMLLGASLVAAGVLIRATSRTKRRRRPAA